MVRASRASSLWHIDISAYVQPSSLQLCSNLALCTLAGRREHTGGCFTASACLPSLRLIVGVNVPRDGRCYTARHGAPSGSGAQDWRPSGHRQTRRAAGWPPRDCAVRHGPTTLVITGAATLVRLGNADSTSRPAAKAIARERARWAPMRCAGVRRTQSLDGKGAARTLWPNLTRVRSRPTPAPAPT